MYTDTAFILVYWKQHMILLSPSKRKHHFIPSVYAPIQMRLLLWWLKYFCLYFSDVPKQASESSRISPLQFPSCWWSGSSVKELTTTDPAPEPAGHFKIQKPSCRVRLHALLSRSAICTTGFYGRFYHFWKEVESD